MTADLCPNPLPQAWFFDESLIRFAGAAWSLEPEGITDVARHLCNHSLQCQLDHYNTGDGLDGDQNMWGSERMKQYLREEAGWGDDDVWERQVVPHMKRQTLSLLTAARPTLTARAGCFELFGACPSLAIALWMDPSLPRMLSTSLRHLKTMPGGGGFAGVDPKLRTPINGESIRFSIVD